MIEESPKSEAKTGTPAPAADIASPPVESPSEEMAGQATTLHERTIAALSYVSFFAIIPFYLKKDSEFCRFHGKQGMLLAIIFFLAKLLLVLDFLMDLALILQFLVFVRMGFAALSGEWKKMPFIYDRACQLEKALRLEKKEEEEKENIT